ncbi:hypothetical protein D3C76_51570 [compost metagenome]
MEPTLENWHLWRHLQNLIRWRASGVTLDAANDWMDKEIADLQEDIQKQSSGFEAGRL